MKLLAINPGSTSTKIAVYEDEVQVFKTSVEHSASEIESYPTIGSQYPLRHGAVVRSLEAAGIGLGDLSAIVGRGGLLPPVKSGAYRVNESMVDRLMHRPVVEHASNLGAILAWEIAKPLGIPAFIYDPVAVDELCDLARITGLAGVERKSLCHALNMRAAALRCAKDLGRPYPELSLIVAHLGGGISVSLHAGGKMIDISSDDEGPFSPERSGRIPGTALASLCYTSERAVVLKKLRGKGGLVSHLGTNDAREVVARIESGDAQARFVFEAMAYQVAKAIGELATVAKGRVDRIILTGGMAYTGMFVEWIRERVAFIAPVVVLPGENELESLAFGALRVLRGEEQAREYDLG
jgi:butyrate kinase